LRFLKTLFENSYGCRRLEAFATNVSDLTMRFSSPDVCEEAGNRDAGYDAIKQVTSQCISSMPRDEHPSADGSSTTIAEELVPLPCDREGYGRGSFRAAAYCGAIGGGEEAPICDAISALYCKQKFREVVDKDPSCREKALRDPNFNAVVEDACSPI
jgi:hypothetical protein